MFCQANMFKGHYISFSHQQLGFVVACLFLYVLTNTYLFFACYRTELTCFNVNVAVVY